MKTDYQVHDLWCGEAGKRIYGRLYLPCGVEKPRLAIYAHEIGCTHSRARPYAEHLAAEGVALYAPDFRGGGDHSRSEGSTLDMSVMTEVEDLGVIMDAARGWDFVDGERPVVIGASQGGFVSAIYAGRNPERMGALILLYPGFVIPYVTKREKPKLDEAPEKFLLHGWLWVGKRFVRDVWDYDAYAETMNYQGPVLILHGDRDEIVPMEHVTKAARLYKNARFVVFPGAGHMYAQEYVDRSLGEIDGFLRSHGLL